MSQLDSFNLVSGGELFTVSFPHVEKNLPMRHPCAPGETDYVSPRETADVDTGDVDLNGHPIYATVPVCYDDGENSPPPTTPNTSPPVTTKPPSTTNPGTNPPVTTKPPVSTSPPNTEAPITYINEDGDAFAVAIREGVVLEGSDLNDKSFGPGEYGVGIAAEKGIDITSNPYADRIISEVHPDQWADYGLVPPTTTTSEAPTTTRVLVPVDRDPVDPYIPPKPSSTTTGSAPGSEGAIPPVASDAKPSSSEEQEVPSSATTTELVVIISDENAPAVSEAIVTISEDKTSETDSGGAEILLIPAALVVAGVLMAITRRSRRHSKGRPRYA